MPVTIATSPGTSQSGVQGSGGNGFPFVQVGDFYYAVNYWGVNLNLNDASGSWTIPCGPQINGNCYEAPEEGSAEDSGECKMCWRIQDVVYWNTTGGQSNPGDTSRVWAYPFILFGSLGGRKETWGVPCGQTTALASTGRCNGINNPTGEAVYDMRVPNAAIGLPERYDRITTQKFCFSFNKDCGGDPTNIENVFIDTYLHRIYQPALFPAGHTGTATTPGNWGDVNKINENATETWNLNFKLCLPEFSLNNPNINDPAAAATGGVLLNQTPITLDGRQWGVFIKWENIGGSSQPRDTTTGIQGSGNICENSFFYISFVPWSATNPGGQQNEGICSATDLCIDFLKFLQFVGSQEFKDRVLGQNGYTPASGKGQANYPRWVWEQVGEPDFVVDNPSGYVLDGIMLGNELWFSPNDVEACVCWSNVEHETSKGTFGKRVESDDPDPDPTCIESNIVTAVVNSQGANPSNEVTCVVEDDIDDDDDCACDPIVGVISEPEDCTDPIGEYTVLSVKGCDCCALDIRQTKGPYVAYTYDSSTERLTIGPYTQKGKAEFCIRCCKDSGDCKTSG